MRGLIVLVVAMLTVGAAAGAVAAPVQTFTLTMTEFQFTPKTFTLAAGTAVELVVVNKGVVDHEFMLYSVPKSMGMEMDMDMDAYGAENTYYKGIGTIEVASGGKTSRSSRLERVMVTAGKAATIRFVAKKAGTFEFGCHVPGHYEAGMKGTLTVK